MPEQMNTCVSTAALAALCDLIARNCKSGHYPTRIPRLILRRADAPEGPVEGLYQPLLCIVAQGKKRAMLGNHMVEYGAGECLLVSVDLPVGGEVTEASRERPYLAVTLGLDPSLIAGLMAEARSAPPVAVARGLAVSPLTPDLLEAVMRLVRLVERPHDIAVLAPLAERELLYHLLQGEQHAMLLQIALADSHLARISRAIAQLRRDYRRRLTIDGLARLAGMSPSSFHRHFKAITAMSPLQFQKVIRLHEARRLLLAQGADAAGIGFTVGYESPSQFSREYRRLFGVPPKRDSVALRQAHEPHAHRGL